MPCIDDKGTLSPVAERLLRAMADGHSWSAVDVARAAELPLFRVRATLRELAAEELVSPAEPDAFRLAGRARVLLGV